MAALNYYKYTNVNPENFLYNIRNVAQINGWTIDNYFWNDSSNYGELYLHSFGYGSQNLYYSMRLSTYSHPAGGNNLYRLIICGNLGYDNTKAFDNQPGKWHSNSISPFFGTLINFNVIEQHIFANDKIIIIIPYTIENFNYSTFPAVLHLGFGTIEIYQSQNNNSNTGNFLFHSSIYSTDPGYILVSGIFGTSGIHSSIPPCFAVLFLGNVKYTTSGSSASNLGLSNSYGVYATLTQGSLSWGERYITSYNLGFVYNAACKFLTFTNRAVMLKTIVSVKHIIGGYNYFFPIGELPIYMCPYYPYFTLGQQVTYGTRTFVVFPVLKLNNTTGFAIEINTE